MKNVALSLFAFCLPAWGQFCPNLMEDLGEPKVRVVTGTPAFRDTLEELELPFLSVLLGQDLGREVARMGIDLAGNRPLIALIEQVLKGAIRQAAEANGFNPWSSIFVRLHVEPDQLVLVFQDQARARNNPWDSPERRALTAQGTPVPAIWTRIVGLDLPYYFESEAGSGNIFAIAIPWNLAL